MLDSLYGPSVTLPAPIFRLQESQPFEMAEPLKECSLFEAALFLRFLYRPHELMVPSSLAAVQDSLPVLLFASHKLDAGLMTNAVASYLAGDLWDDTIAPAEHGPIGLHLLADHACALACPLAPPMRRPAHLCSWPGLATQAQLVIAKCAY